MNDVSQVERFLSWSGMINMFGLAMRILARPTVSPKYKPWLDQTRPDIFQNRAKTCTITYKYCVVWYYIILYCVVLYYIVLYCCTLHFIIIVFIATRPFQSFHCPKDCFGLPLINYNRLTDCASAEKPTSHRTMYISSYY